MGGTCQRCESGEGFHLHCIVCRRPLEPPSKVVCRDCRPVYEREKRKATRVLIRVKFEENGEWHRIWVPKSSLASLNRLYRPLYTSVQVPVQESETGTGLKVVRARHDAP